MVSGPDWVNDVTKVDVSAMIGLSWRTSKVSRDGLCSAVVPQPNSHPEETVRKKNLLGSALFVGCTNSSITVSQILQYLLTWTRIGKRSIENGYFCKHLDTHAFHSNIFARRKVQIEATKTLRSAVGKNMKLGKKDVTNFDDRRFPQKYARTNSRYKGVLSPPPQPNLLQIWTPDKRWIDMWIGVFLMWHETIYFFSSFQS